MKILIELPTWLGDCVMATPAIENIVNFYNDVKLPLLVHLYRLKHLKVTQKQ